MPYSDPNKARNYQREYRRLQRAGESTTPGTSRLPAEFRLDTARDVLDLLDEQVNAVRNEPAAGTLEKHVASATWPELHLKQSRPATLQLALMRSKQC